MNKKTIKRLKRHNSLSLPATPKRCFYGTTTLGEKGQVVIPAPARAAMSIRPGEKLLVFGMDTEMIAFVKLTKVEQIAAHFASHLGEIQKIIKKTK